MSRTGHGRRRGFTLLELLVVISLVCILLTVAFDRLLRWMELAEKSAMETSVGAMKSALHLQLGSLYATGNVAGMARLAGENPFDWLSQKPEQYVGTLFDPTLAEVDPGAWYYDRAERQVVYRPQRTRYLIRPRPDEDPRIRFRVVMEFLPPESGAEGLRSLAGADLTPVVPYLWQSGDKLR
jgi:prepilin-type N-terminal cleavage/methylation domain-containing protein